LGQNDYVEHIDETLLKLIKPYITYETIFIVDESDIEKPYVKKMEMPIINLLDTKCKRDLEFQEKDLL
jgi:hypothetical protein